MAPPPGSEFPLICADLRLDHGIVRNETRATMMNRLSPDV
jgi:hypothetical protein